MGTHAPASMDDYLALVLDLFAHADVPGGPEHYAEPFQPRHPLKMPFNAAVNIAYTLVGLLWMYRLFSGKIKLYRNYYALMVFFSFVYGPVQLARITTQSRAWGILDQWITLPIFSVVPAWNIALHRNRNASTKGSLSALPWHFGTTLAIVTASTLSYFLAALRSDGFDIALGLHILAALVTSVVTVRDVLGASKSKAEAAAALGLPLVGAALSCLGFVFLKIYDFEVTAALQPHTGSRNISGHFISKICDAAQIHFILRFFSEVIARLHKQKAA